MKPLNAPPSEALSNTRSVTLRAAGNCHGAVTRLMSPGDIGEVVKPFVFLDDYSFEKNGPHLFGIHPHSGIATLTYATNGHVRILDTLGTDSVLAPGDIEWFRAGNGAWHEADRVDDETIAGLQLWIALPPHLENGVPESRHVLSAEVPRQGPASILLGSYGGLSSPIAHDEGVTYMSVELEAGQRWRFMPPSGHRVVWAYVYRGSLCAGLEPLGHRELAIFEQSESVIDFTADGPSAFVLGSAIPHAHPLVLGAYSVHTSIDALALGREGIKFSGAHLLQRRTAENPSKN